MFLIHCLPDGSSVFLTTSTIVTSIIKVTTQTNWSCTHCVLPCDVYSIIFSAGILIFSETDWFSLRILPLMQWFELHDILFLVNCIKNPPDNFSLSDYLTFTSGPTRLTSNFKLKHTFSKFSASRHFYFNRLPRLWNSLPPIDTTKSTQTIKYNLTIFSGQNFLKSFNSSNPCSFHFLCPCNKCVPVGFSTFSHLSI